MGASCFIVTFLGMLLMFPSDIWSRGKRGRKSFLDSTKLPYGKHQKFNWSTVGLWFSNPVERGTLTSRQLPNPKIAAKNLA